MYTVLGFGKYMIILSIVQQAVQKVDNRFLGHGGVGTLERETQTKPLQLFMQLYLPDGKGILRKKSLSEINANKTSQLSRT